MLCFFGKACFPRRRNCNEKKEKEKPMQSRREKSPALPASAAFSCCERPELTTAYFLFRVREKERKADEEESPGEKAKRDNEVTPPILWLEHRRVKRKKHFLSQPPSLSTSSLSQPPLFSLRCLSLSPRSKAALLPPTPLLVLFNLCLLGALLLLVLQCKKGDFAELR